MSSTIHVAGPWNRTWRVLAKGVLAAKQVNWSIHYEGLLFAMLRIAAKLPGVFGWDVTSSAWFQQLAERQYDRRFGVHTAGTVPINELDMTDERRSQAVEYTPTTGAKFGCLLSQLPIDYQNFTFVDFGCGKGRSMLMASDFPFRKIVGVELSSKLERIAEENIAKYHSRHQRCFELDAQQGDATEFRFPDEPLVLYFFNPFSAVILEQVLANVAASVKQSPREVLIIYYNPQQEQILSGSTAFERFICPGWNDPKWVLYRAV